MDIISHIHFVEKQSAAKKGKAELKGLNNICRYIIFSVKVNL
jgi:hypothetical protein